jgi:uncharacterized membrane protein
MNGHTGRGVPYKRVETTCYGGIFMKVGTFLIGGIAGAAAVIYFNRKAKSMMFSAFNSSSTSPSTSSRNNNSQQQEKPAKMNSVMHQAVNEILSDNQEKSAGMH